MLETLKAALLAALYVAPNNETTLETLTDALTAIDPSVTVGTVGPVIDVLVAEGKITTETDENGVVTVTAVASDEALEIAPTDEAVPTAVTSAINELFAAEVSEETKAEFLDELAAEGLTSDDAYVGAYTIKYVALGLAARFEDGDVRTSLMKAARLAEIISTNLQVHETA